MSSKNQKNTLNLTKAYIDRAIHQGGLKTKDIRWDTQIRNFGVRLYPSGQKTFVLFYRFKGRQRLMKLGSYGIKTLDEARREARQKLVTVDKGVDPLAQRESSNCILTVKELCSSYMERYAKPHKKSWTEDQRLINRYVLPSWGNLKITQIQRTDVSSLHHKIGKTSRYEANRTKSLLSKIWECSREWGFTSESVLNPTRGIESFPEKKRKRYVREDEIPQLAMSIDQEPNIYIRSAFWLYLLTGLRKSELLEAKWSQLSEAAGGKWTLQITDTKTGEPLDLPLSPPAVAFFKQLPRVDGNPYIFCGHLKGRSLVGIQKNWQRVRERAGLGDIRLHDLRHTVGSWLTQGGSSLYLVGKILNHTDQSITQRYAHLEQEQMRTALDHHGAKMTSVANSRALKEV